MPILAHSKPPPNTSAGIRIDASFGQPFPGAVTETYELRPAPAELGGGVELAVGGVCFCMCCSACPTGGRTAHAWPMWLNLPAPTPVACPARACAGDQLHPAA